MSTSLLFKKHIYVLLYDYITTLHNLQQYVFDLKYGNNSAVLAKNGATLNLKNLVVNTQASGANGVFSYGGSATTDYSSSDGTTVNISDSKITTSNATLEAKASEGVVIEGVNSVSSNNCKLIDNNTELNGQSTVLSQLIKEIHFILQILQLQ